MRDSVPPTRCLYRWRSTTSSLALRLDSRYDYNVHISTSGILVLLIKNDKFFNRDSEDLKAFGIEAGLLGIGFENFEHSDFETQNLGSIFIIKKF